MMTKEVYGTKTIKFRAWRHAGSGGDPYASGVMLYDETPGDCFCWRAEGQDLDIMQYTGMDDKHGTPIFEGDIVRRYQARAIDEATDYRVFNIGWSEEGAWFQLGSDTNTWSALSQDEASRRIEVIGNIWEHGDLLTHSDKAA